MTTGKKATLLTLVLSHYRVPVHERVRALLAEHNIEFEILYSDPEGADAKKGDTATLDWAKKVPLKTFGIGGRKLHYQKALAATRDSDLVIVSQENKLLMNYLLLLRSMRGAQKLAFFGHGRGFQSRNPGGLAEKWKRFLAKRVGWWFAYTHGVGAYLQSIGFPKARITVFENSIDTRNLAADIAAVTNKDIAAFKKKIGIKGRNVCVYIGGMYEEKRLDYLCEAAIEIRAKVPDFELLLIGGGSKADIARHYADHHDFIHAPGSMFGKDRATALKLSKLFLMPGLVGLAVIDSFVGECPLVTTDYPYHSPEIDYLEPGVNGIKIADNDDPAFYADAVADLLQDPGQIKTLKAGCQESALRYTAENMAERLAEGIRKALA